MPSRHYSRIYIPFFVVSSNYKVFLIAQKEQKQQYISGITSISPLYVSITISHAYALTSITLDHLTMFVRSASFQRSASRCLIAARNFATTAENSAGVVYKGATYPFKWLRDSCQCPECVHPSTHQKLHRTTDIPANVRPATNGVQSTEDGVSITWASGHRSSYPSSFLQAYASPASLHQFHHDVEACNWNKEQISSARDLFVPYANLKTPSGLLAATTQLTRYGLLFVTGVPTNETANDTCEARKLAETFGEIRTTMYGKLWDVINVRDSKNIAYTNLDLGLHMDLLYA